MDDEKRIPIGMAHDFSLLRQRAEKLQKPVSVTEVQNMTPHEVRLLIQELQIHQTELEMQNHQLQLATQELETARAKYHDLYQHSPFGYVTLDEHGVIEEVNTKSVELLATTKEQLVARRFSQFVQTESLDAFYGFFKKVLLSEKTQTVELQVVSQTDLVFYAQLEGMLLRRDNETDQCRIAFVDVTERKTAHLKLASKEALLSTIINSSLNAIQVFKAVRDSNGTLIDFEWMLLNKTAELFLDYTLEQMRRHRLTDLFPSFLTDGHFFTFIHVVENGQPATFTAHFKENKTEHWLNCVAVKLEDGFVLTFEDVTQQRIANEKLQESQLLIKKTAEAMPDFLYVEDLLQGRNLYNNRDFLAFLGYKPYDIKGHPRELLDTLYHPQDAHLLLRRSERFASQKDGNYLEHDVRIKAKDNTWRNIRFRETVFKRGPEGVPTQLVGVAQDITEKLRSEEDLRQKNKTINTILENLPVIMWRLDAQGRIEKSIGSGLYNLNYQDHELEGKHIKDINSSISPNIDKILKGHKDIFIGEALVQGRRIYKQNYFVYDKETGGAVGFCLDITEQKQAEAEARYRNMLLDQLLKNLPLVLAVLDEQGSYLELKGNGLKKLNIADNELIGQSVFNAFPHLKSNIDDVLAGQVKTFTSVFQNQGQQIHFQNFGFLDQDQKNGIVFGIDITEFKTMQERLLAEKEFSENLLEHSIDGILAFDADLKVTVWNRAMERFTYRRREDILGKSVLSLFPEERHKRVQFHLQQVMEGHPLTTDKIPSFVTDQSFEVNIVPLTNPDQKVIGALCLVHDVTLQKQRQQANVQAKLDQQNAVANAVLSAQEEERKRIAEALHNSLGQLLYAAKLNIENLIPEDSSPQPTNVVALKRVTDFLEEAIKETRSLAHELIPKALQDFGLKTVLKEMARRLSTEHFYVQCVVTGFDPPMGATLETVLFRIVQELLNNIMKHAEATEALVQVLDKGDSIMVRVHDNGKGLPAKLEQLSSKGIGLSTIQNRLELLQGKMHVRSKNNEGTTITIEFKKEA